MMNKRWIVMLLCSSLVAFAACNSKAKQATVTEEEAEVVVLEPQTAPNNADTSNLTFLTEWVGKYPKEVDLFKLNVLTSRLQQMMGTQYDSLVANWNTETPIQLEDSVIHTSGCKVHDCPADSYDLYIDLAGNNINVYNFQYDTLYFFAEKDSFSLPAQMKADLNIIKSNAKLTKKSK